jgi:hypothetical protein
MRGCYFKVEGIKDKGGCFLLLFLTDGIVEKTLSIESPWGIELILRPRF